MASGIKVGIAMGYLFLKLFWYVLAAFVVGLVVGWVTCSRIEDGQA